MRSKPTVLTARFDPAEVAEVTLAAAALGVSRSELLRASALERAHFALGTDGKIDGNTKRTAERD